MFDNPVYRYQIERILEHYKIRKGPADMWYTPFREEEQPSFRVDTSHNVWYDDGLGIGGTNVELVQMIDRCSEDEAERKILQMMDEPVTQPSRQGGGVPGRAECLIKEIRQIRTPFLMEYIRSRGIPVETANLYCREVVTRDEEKGRTYCSLGFLNNRKGYALKSPSGYQSTTRAGITTIDPNGCMTLQPGSTMVLVFEGFFDFLTLLAMQGATRPDADVVVLNAISNLSRAIPYLQQHTRIECFLDNDDAGRKCMESMRSMLTAVSLIDQSGTYGDYKDLNEYWMARLQNTKK